MFHQISTQQLSDSGERIVATIRQPIDITIRQAEGDQDYSVQVGASFGCTAALPNDTPATLIARADRLMYDMKAAATPAEHR